MTVPNWNMTVTSSTEPLNFRSKPLKGLMFVPFFDIVTDSAGDFDSEKITDLDITVIPFKVSFNGEDYFDDWIDMKADKFIHTVIDNPDYIPKTATPAPELYISAFERIIEQGKDVLCICATQTLTSVIRTAEAAKDTVLEKYPNAKIEVMDSEQLTVAQTDFVVQAVKLRCKNVTLAEAVKKLIKVRDLSRTYFFIQSTKYLRLGGRIGKVSAVTTSILNIKPLIVLKGGEISPFGVSRSRKNAINKIVMAAKDYLHKEKIAIENISCSIGASGDVVKELPILRKLLETELKITVNAYEALIGACVTAHTGPGIVGFSLIRKVETV